MTRKTWKLFEKIRDSYREAVDRMLRSMPELHSIQQRFIDSRSPSYTAETPVVYNGALDDVRPDSEIRLILAGDNPGRREQAAENRRYLVGPSGKIAEKFFRDNTRLNIDFRKNVIILNKTPVHTPRTADLKELCKMGGPHLAEQIILSQQYMAKLLLEFHQAFASDDAAVRVWITGYSEMKKGGVFEAYTNALKSVYGNTPLKEQVFLYRHFSMNQFTIDLKQQAVPSEPLEQTLARIGRVYRQRFLW